MKLFVRDGHVWVSDPLDDDWIVHARYTMQGDRPVIAEIRLFSDRSATPPSGLTHAVARKIPFGKFGPFLMAQYSVTRTLPVRGVREHFDRVITSKLPKLAKSGERPRARRNTGRDDAFYAELARDYLVAIQGGSSRPIKDLATQRRQKPDRVRDWVHEARARELLSKGQPGQRGGHLLPRAEELLKEQKQRSK